ncbi:hypothetical protein HD597_009056 [Nonomuraea thailandensis]|uniref:Uncharacterized protein n=1 Tax=Nonomuraea thailandensis TaxID=1188745 RepID=A0A9X2K9P1_9ACTN|nr:hypothetical protein [Nonomuraea thailandensis]MCP2362036.1 hypothetical protein [Nonomuraea thailandensis]
MTAAPFEAEWPLAGRQLDALRSTYPAWEIHFRVDAPSAARWTAVLLRPMTARLSAHGVRERVGCPDAITLASTLARQSGLLHKG